MALPTQKAISGSGVIRTFPAVVPKVGAQPAMQQKQSGGSRLEEESEEVQSAASTPAKAAALLQQQQEEAQASQGQRTTIYTLQDLIDMSEDGDCIYIQAGEHRLMEPLRVAEGRHVFLIGFDELSSTPATLIFDVREFKLGLPLIRVSNGATVSMTQLTLVLSANGRGAEGNGNAPHYDATSTYLTDVLDGGQLTLQRCTLISAANGVNARSGSYCTLTDCRICCPDHCCVTCGDDARIHVEGATLERSRCGVFVHSRGRACVLQSSITGVNIGVQIDGHGFARVEDCSVEGCNFGIILEDECAAPEPPIIQSCRFLQCGRGIYTRGEGCVVDVLKNTFSKCVTSAICIDGGNALVRSCAIDSSDNFGVEVLGGRPTIEANVFDRCQTAAIVVSGIPSMPSILANDIGLCGPTFNSAAGLLLSNPQVSSSKTSGADDSSCGDLSSPEATSEHELSELGAKMRASQLLEMQSALLPEKVGIGVWVEDGAAPRVDGNHFQENLVNVWVDNALGFYVQNVAKMAARDNFICQGSVTNVTITQNHILGSKTAAAVTVIDGARCSITKNIVEHAKLAAIALRACGETNISGNTMKDCQDAIVAMAGAQGTATRNETRLRMEVFSDASESFIVVG